METNQPTEPTDETFATWEIERPSEALSNFVLNHLNNPRLSDIELF